MQTIQRILVPTDFSDQSSIAFTYAMWLASVLDAAVELIHVVYPGTDVMDFPAMAAQSTKVQLETAEQVMKVFVDQGMVRLQTLTDLDKVPEVTSSIEIGAASNVITSVAEENPSTLIVLGTRGQHNQLEVAFGSVTTAVVRKATVPVLVIPEEVRRMHIATIGYATSFDDSDAAHIRDVIRIFDDLKPALKIVHVKDDSDSENADLTALKNAISRDALGVPTSYHATDAEDVAEGLETFTENEGIDLLIMFAPHRNLFERIVHKSITRKMALYSHVPLLVMK